MTRVLRTIALIAIAAMLNAPARSAGQSKPDQNNKEAFKLSVSTHFVLVPVIVTDNKGNHVTGLKAEDFELKEDSNVQKISRLDELTADAVKVPASQTSPQAFSNQVAVDHPKKLEIIAFDQVNTPFASSRDGQRMLVEFLAKNVDANTLLSLVALGHNGPRIIHDFTHDPAVLIAAVKKLQTTLNSRDALTLNTPGDNFEADYEALQIAAILNGSDTTNIGTPQQAAAVAKAQRAQVDASRQAQEGLITLENFQKLAQYFQGVPGRKSLIWASTGFPFALGAAAQASTRGTTNDDWQRTFRMLTDANIAVYPVDIGGLLPGANANTLQSIDSAGMIKNGGADGGVSQRTAVLTQVETGAFVDPTIARHDTMHQVADMTGGQAFYNSNDGAELFRRAGEDASQYYMLGYYTKDTGKFGWRKLAVKVNRDGVKVRARSGFVFSDPKKEADPNTPLKDLRMALGSDLSFTSIPIKGQWQQVEPAGNQKKVHFTLSIPPGVAAIDAEQQNHISLEFLITATDASGKSAANISQRWDTKLPPEGVEQIQTQGVDYANALTLPPNNYTVHFVVRDNLRGTLGSVVTPLKLE